MNSLYKQLQDLEENIVARKVLSQLQYQQVKDKMRSSITSPQAFGTVFLAGLLFAKRRRPRKAANSVAAVKPSTLLPTLTNLFYFSSEFSGLMSVAKYFKKKTEKFFKSDNKTST